MKLKPSIRITISKYRFDFLLRPVLDYIDKVAVGVCIKTILDNIPDAEIYVDKLYTVAEGDVDTLSRLMSQTIIHEWLHYLGIRDEAYIDSLIRWLYEEI